MGQMDELSLAREVLATRFPDATCAFLSAASTGTARTATSDLDIVVIEGKETASRWEGFHCAEVPVELFVADLQGWERYVASEVNARKPVVLRITATGWSIRADSAGAMLKATAQHLLDAGPPPFAPSEVDLRRRLLSDLLDDLRDVDDDIERAFLVQAVLKSTAELFLGLRQRWLGSGKWLGRLVAAESREVARDLVDGARSAHNGMGDRLLAVADRILADAGGRPMRSDWVAYVDDE